jgi:beta-glucanase (GH16 family)
MKNILRLVFVIIVFSTSCSKKKPIWSDEFDYTGSPDSTKWSYDLGDGCPNNCGWGNNEAEYYTGDFNNARIENGTLIIEAHKDSLGGKAYTSARIKSKLKGDWLYGRIEVKAQLPKGKGTWPAIWMLPTDWKYGGWPASGEIDIMEHVGYDPGVIHGTIHTYAHNHSKGTQKEGKIKVQDSMDAFHLYAMDWAKDKIDFYVDNDLYFTVKRDPKDDYKEWPFDQRFHLIMNIAVGGNWGGKDGIDDSIWPQRMVVDYVRVFQ